MNKGKNCAIIGEPPMSYVWGYDEEDQRCCATKLLLLNRLSRLQTERITDFFIPLDAGVGLYAAEMVIDLMTSNPNLHLHCLIPYEDQACKWTPELRDRYYNVLEKCTDSAPVSLNFSLTCDIDAVMEAIDQSNTLIAVQSDETAQDKVFSVALRYAKRIGRRIELIRAPCS